MPCAIKGISQVPNAYFESHTYKTRLRHGKPERSDAESDEKHRRVDNFPPLCTLQKEIARIVFTSYFILFSEPPCDNAKALYFESYHRCQKPRICDWRNSASPNAHDPAQAPVIAEIPSR